MYYYYNCNSAASLVENKRQKLSFPDDSYEFPTEEIMRTQTLHFAPQFFEMKNF